MLRRPALAALLVLVVSVGACSDDAPSATDDASTTTVAASPSSSSEGASADEPTDDGSAAPDEPGGAAGSAGCEGQAPAAGRSEETVTSGGEERTYLRYVPSDAPDGPRPLVIDFTAYSPADLQERISGFTLPGADGTVPADEHGAVVVTPAPIGGAGELLTWNLSDQPGWADDDLFLDDMVARVGADTCIAEDQILVMGFAIGGAMASRFACNRADEVALLVAVSGLDDPPGCAPSRPVPVLAIHGTGDRFLPYDGGVGAGAGGLPLSPETTAGLIDVVTRRGPVTETAAAWATRNECGDVPASERLDGDGPVTVDTWSGCDDDATVELVTIDDGEHTWPGSTTMDDLTGILGPVSDAVVANDLIWSTYEDVTAG